MDYIYDHSGLLGVEYSGETYLYRKDVQGNIIAILDSAGNVVVKYSYDVWGNHAVLDANGNDITDPNNIGNLNPFRYRGYYYDTETGLYYLQTRYYDPEVGRFITIDGIEYIDPETINGLNLYAYCGNNPVMNVDPEGHKWYEFWKWDWASIGKIALGVAVIAACAVGSVLTGGTLSIVLAGAAIGAAAGFLGGGISGAISGGFAGFANGAMIGSIVGGISGAIATTGLGIGWQMGINAVLNVGGYVAGQALSGSKITFGGILLSALIGAFVGFVGGHGWTSAGMGAGLLVADVAENMGKNFLSHTVEFLGVKFFGRFFVANIGAGFLSGIYNKSIDMGMSTGFSDLIEKIKFFIKHRYYCYG